MEYSENLGHCVRAVTDTFMVRQEGCKYGCSDSDTRHFVKPFFQEHRKINKYSTLLGL
jgi:hypothetical protein